MGWGLIAGLILLSLAYINPQKTGEVAGDAVGSVLTKAGEAIWSFVDSLSFNIGDALSSSLGKKDWNDGKKKWIGFISILELIYWISRATSPRVSVTTGGVTVSGQSPFGGGFSIGTGGAGRSSGRRTVRTVTEKGGKVQEVVTTEEEVEEERVEKEKIPFDEEEVRQEIVERLQETGKDIQEFTARDAQVLAKTKPASQRKSWYDRYMYYVKTQKKKGGKKR